MPSLFQIAVFLAVILTLTGLAHAYLFHHMVRLPDWPSPARRFGLGLILFLAVLLPFTMVASRVFPRIWAQPFAWVGFVWMGILYFLLYLIFAFDLVRFAASKLWPTQPVDPERRQLIHRTAAASLTGATSLLTGISLRSALGETDIREVEVKLDRLPKSLSGLSIVQLSDIHIGPILGDGFLSGIVERVNALKPDLVAITGDLVDGSVNELFEHVAPLSKLRARFGTYFVTGNHEYYSGAAAWSKALTKLGIRVLHNQRTLIGDQGGHIELVGIDDWHQYRSQARVVGEQLKQRLAPEHERILLAHQPQAIGEAVRFDAGLQISGHTHGGQLFPTAAFVALTTPYVAGLYRHDARTQIYVSRGTGFWGPPMRLLAPAEITRIVVTA